MLIRSKHIYWISDHSPIGIFREPVGHNITLWWNFTSDIDILEIFERPCDGKDIYDHSIARFDDGAAVIPTSHHSKFHKRISVHGDNRRSFGIRITNVTLDDAGEYCLDKVPFNSDKFVNESWVLFIWGKLNLKLSAFRFHICRNLYKFYCLNLQRFLFQIDKLDPIRTNIIVNGV